MQGLVPVASAVRPVKTESQIKLVVPRSVSGVAKGCVGVCGDVELADGTWCSLMRVLLISPSPHSHAAAQWFEELVEEDIGGGAAADATPGDSFPTRKQHTSASTDL